MRGASDTSRAQRGVTTRRYAAVAADLIGRSPCRGIKLPERAVPDVASLGAEELQAIADELGEWWAPMLWLGALRSIDGSAKHSTVDRCWP
jgi:hypothetical protein